MIQAHRINNTASLLFIYRYIDSYGNNQSMINHKTWSLIYTNSTSISITGANIYRCDSTCWFVAMGTLPYWNVAMDTTCKDLVNVRFCTFVARFSTRLSTWWEMWILAFPCCGCFLTISDWILVWFNIVNKDLGVQKELRAI